MRRRLPALAALALLLGPAAARAADGGCSAAMAHWQGHEAELSALGDAGLGPYNSVQNAIDRAAHLCEAGRDGEAARAVAGQGPRGGAGLSPAASP